MEPARRMLLSGRSLLTGGAEGDALTVTIKHKFGETTIKKTPKRVVCVGLVEQDALLALGIVPVAVTKWFGEAPGCIFPWTTDELPDVKLPTVLDATSGIPVEKVAAQAPDLIIGLYSGVTKRNADCSRRLPRRSHSRASTSTTAGQDVDHDARVTSG